MIELRILILLVLAGLGLAPRDCAQEPTPPQDPKPRQQQAAPQEPLAKASAKAVAEWIADLGADSFRKRLDAEAALRDIGPRALAELKTAAESAEDQEVQWRAQRLIRQIERGDQGLAPRRPATKLDEAGQPGPMWLGRLPRERLPEAVQQRFDQMFQRMERDFGLDIPRARFFQDDFFRDLQEQLKAGGGRSQGMSMEIGPDGKVRVEVKETNESGEVETKTYEAETMDQFESQHPGVLRQDGLGTGLPWLAEPGSPLARGWMMPRFGRQPLDVRPDVDEPTPGDAVVEPPPAGRRLGILIRPVLSEELRQHLELEDGVGLMVESVQPGTLAESLGLQRGDIVTKIAGCTISAAKDVQEALGGVEAGALVEVAFVRKGVERVASAIKTETTLAPEETPRNERLERRPAKRDSSIR